MYYELYIDSLFFSSFCLNFLSLNLVNKRSGSTATQRSLFAGAAWGAVVYCTMFLMPVLPAVFKIILGFGISGGGMLLIPFRCRSLRSLLRMMISLLGISFFLGGIFFFLQRELYLLGWSMDGLTSIMGLGVVSFLIGKWIITRKRRKDSSYCQVVIKEEGQEIILQALLDTGNSLVEPISRKPVSIIDTEAAKQLFPKGFPEFYRVVPYTSIGKKKGILKCYEIPMICVEVQDVVCECVNVLVAYSEEYESKQDYHIILNPRLIYNQEEREYGF